ncbi:Phosphatidylinositol 3,4,5-trisphosphate-dependent Rac exchanger 2 protein [Nowakowskiella sp. JEL0407]|nr:Phosphatidylinositol 3,4,5-trisphosphate-dependent Rac exchanger 2 protein [Nowakowskiella sp. JEL0407]
MNSIPYTDDIIDSAEDEIDVLSFKTHGQDRESGHLDLNDEVKPKHYTEVMQSPKSVHGFSSASVLKTSPRLPRNEPIHSKREYNQPVSNERSVNSSSYRFESPMEDAKQKREMIISELWESEVGYVNDLRTLVESCFNRLNVASWLPSDKKFLLIRNANDLFKFQQEFLMRLDNCIKPNQSNFTEANIGYVFILMKEKFKVYTHYCTHHDGALRILTEYENRPEMITFLQEFRGRIRSKLDIRDFLIKPIQRICRYPLLLNELIKTTEPMSPSYSDLLEAHTIMKKIACEIDDAKWLLENIQRTDTFFSRLEDFNRDSFVYSPRMKYGDILFSGSLIVVNHDEFPSSLTNSWHMRNLNLPSQSYEFGAKSEKERESWLKVLKCVPKLQHLNGTVNRKKSITFKDDTFDEPTSSSSKPEKRFETNVVNRSVSFDGIRNSKLKEEKFGLRNLTTMQRRGSIGFLSTMPDEIPLGAGTVEETNTLNPTQHKRGLSMPPNTRRFFQKKDEQRPQAPTLESSSSTFENTTNHNPLRKNTLSKKISLTLNDKEPESPDLQLVRRDSVDLKLIDVVTPVFSGSTLPSVFSLTMELGNRSFDSYPEINSLHCTQSFKDLQNLNPNRSSLIGPSRSASCKSVAKDRTKTGQTRPSTVYDEVKNFMMGDDHGSDFSDSQIRDKRSRSKRMSWRRKSQRIAEENDPKSTESDEVDGAGNSKNRKGAFNTVESWNVLPESHKSAKRRSSSLSYASSTTSPSPSTPQQMPFSSPSSQHFPSRTASSLYRQHSLIRQLSLRSAMEESHRNGSDSGATLFDAEMGESARFLMHENSTKGSLRSQLSNRSLASSSPFSTIRKTDYVDQGGSSTVNSMSSKASNSSLGSRITNRSLLGKKKKSGLALSENFVRDNSIASEEPIHRRAGSGVAKVFGSLKTLFNIGKGREGN